MGCNFVLVRPEIGEQCKARWYEWLDPSIKKSEWSRDEDEKLLHLAKLMPTQWRTIAPIVGRTPSQCLQRYEKLLDDNYEPGDDPRKLRPGEIDPNPESKPARPDPVDMDEDEKEMLSVARARLANTRGKKAKRKAREQQLEEARILASLQKTRELKAAGIDVRNKKRKRSWGIDYNAEIPFEKRPPPGFYDIADEDQPAKLVKLPTTIEELEGERRVDKEARLRKHDVAKNKIAQRQDAPSAILQANKRKRSRLNLPAPQIPDHELEAIAKIGIASDSYSLGMTRKGTPMRDELHINEDLDMHEGGKLRQSDLRKEVLSGLKNLPQPKSDYQILIQIQPFPEEDEEQPEEKMEEDMSDRISREKRSKVLQRELINNTLTRADGDKSSFVPQTSADELIRTELVSLLEHDNVKYPLDEKTTKEKKIGAANGKSLPVPDFEEIELKEADENESLDKTCLNGIMYFPTRSRYGLSSVANNLDKLAALQNEFENVKRKMDDETKKAQRLEQKVKLVTNGYQVRANKLWTQIEATFKQMDTAGTEVECFQALNQQEQVAATHRISNLWEEIQKHKDLERILQKRYGDLSTELERLQHVTDTHRVLAQRG